MKFRAFISTDIDVSESIWNFYNALMQYDTSLKVVNPENIHITLKFLGNIDEKLVPRIKKIMEESVKGINPFYVNLRGVGAFPSMSNIRVIWIGISNSELLGNISNKLEEKLEVLGFKREARPFSPHITLARTKKAVKMKEIRELMEEWTNTEFSTQLIDRIRLKKSVLTPKGPIYTTVEEVSLHQ